MDDLVRYNSHANTFSSTVAYDWLSWSWNISVLSFSLTLGRRGILYVSHGKIEVFFGPPFGLQYPQLLSMVLHQK